MPEIRDRFLPAGGTVRGDVHLCVPRLKLPENFNPTMHVTRAEPREETIFKEVTHENHFRPRQVNDRVAFGVSARKPDDADFLAAQLKAQFGVKCLCGRRGVDAAHARLQAPIFILRQAAGMVAMMADFSATKTSLPSTMSG